MTEHEIFYYYLRDEQNHPYGCVAIQENYDGTISRGVSICSTEDRFDKKHARGLALRRMNLAKDYINSEYFNPYYGTDPSIPKVKIPFAKKWESEAKPTDFEERILHNPQKG